MIMNSKNLLEETYDVAVVGAGHAGCEAALACARLGLETIIFTVSVIRISAEVPRGIWFVRSMRLAARWESILIRHLFSQKC